MNAEDNLVAIEGIDKPKKKKKEKEDDQRGEKGIERTNKMSKGADKEMIKMLVQ